MRFCVPLTPHAAGGDASAVGGKARSLAALAAAGLRVPAAFAVKAELFRLLRANGPPLSSPRAAEALQAAPYPAGFADELRAQLARITGGDAGARFAVRSSFASEDRPGALAAGLFHSELDVAAEEVPAAIRRVLLSALSPAAVSYTAARGIDVDQAGMAVLIQRFVTGERAGSAAWDPTKAAPVVDGQDGDEAPAAARAAIEAALRTLAAQHGPIEIEWVASGETITFLQLRPFVPAAAAAASDDDVWAARGEDGWCWDASHNPLPLSPAQAGLIALVDQRCGIGLRQRVVGGYLFYARVPDPGPGADATVGVQRQLAITRAHVDDGLAALGSKPPLGPALDTFVHLYQAIFGALQPAARRARQTLRSFARAHGLGDDATVAALLAGVPSIATERRALAAVIAAAHGDEMRAAAVRAYIERFGDETPVWDVAAPTFAEEPRLVAAVAALGPPADDAAAPADRAAEACRARLPPPARARFDLLLGEARAAVAAGEEDDHLYARAQAAVRRALLREGRRLQMQGTLADAADVFWLPLSSVRDDAAGRAPLTTTAAAALVAQARADDRAARAHPPPPRDGDPSADGHVVVGQPAAGGRVVGSAFVHPDPGGALPDAASIVVARALLPTELPLLAAAGLVTEAGGVLDHVAAQARERGIPAVVAAAGACARIKTGDRLLVDGDSGTVTKL